VHISLLALLLIILIVLIVAGFLARGRL